MMTHWMFWNFGEIPEGMWTNGYGPDLADWLLVADELGERVARAFDDEAFGMGALFDLQYDTYLREKGVLV